MKIYLGTDHAGFELKEKIKAFLREKGYQVEDQGAFEFDPEDDYPDFVSMVAKQAGADDGSRGIVFGYSGQGEAICANREKGIHATVFYGGSLETVKLAREHNDSNVLSLGAGFVKEAEAIEAVQIWLGTKFSGD
ncbi:MAG: RpiB/LacA/LacB family sugar-phosphate isomerase, partial [bacterium]